MDLEHIDDVCIAHLRSGSLDELWIEQLGNDLLDLVHRGGCRKLVLHFGELDCLYSVLMGKLVMLKRRMNEAGGELRLYGVSPLVHDVFRVCKLEKMFEFYPDRASALEGW
jgi:anti-sigma B factor antagonist